MILPDYYTVPNQLKPFFHVPNPTKHKMLRLDKPAHFYPDTIFLGSGDTYPPGAAYWSVLRGFRKLEITKPKSLAKKSTSIKLREEQRPIFEKCKQARAGIVEFKTGGGKSVITCALAEAWGGKTLIVAHSMDNVTYFQDQFKKFLGWDVGVYYSKEKVIKDVTVTTFNTAVKYNSVFREFGFDNLVIDEADEFFTDARRKFVTEFPCARKYGFTGTIKTKPDEYMRKDEVPALLRFWGLHIVGVSDDTKDPLEGVYWTRRETDYVDEFGFPVSPQKQWALFRKMMDADIERKKEQLTFVSNNHDHDKDYTLVLLDRVEDVEKYAEAFQKKHNIDRVYKMHGSLKKRDREESIEKFSADGGIFFAQYKTAGRGLDMPKCSKLFIMFPIKGENTVRQMVGRIIRWLPEKKSYVYDWCDSCIEFQWKKRQKIYQKFFNLEPELI